ncbi:hypothetical protein EIN43_13395 [Enterobacter hormaechei]|uniref:Uncharacterized protein n=1 Tax=Enterobacter hormaechei TaxID=158836 RepID=A0A4Y5ZP03_9ENTR|nr:hypothetical protein EIN43_13395 [Enterobacter hormaechei]
MDISAALIDTFVTAYPPVLAEKSGERLKHGGRKRGVMLLDLFAGHFILLLSIWTIGFLQDPWEN